MNLDIERTIVALATPPGIGAIAVIRVSGATTFSVCNTIFPKKDLSKQKSHTIHFGNIIEPDTQEVVDEVLVSVFKNPHSYTRQDTIEISTHGSPYIVQKVISLLLANGAVMAQPGEFTQRAFLNGQLDLSQAEAVADLIKAQSEASHRLAIRQLKGGVSQELAVQREELIKFASLIELELDFSEEDVEFANRAELQAFLNRITSKFQQLLQSFEMGNAIKTGINTVIAGRPNAGKSTLLNVLLNEERAIVSDIEGTTRDHIEEVLNIKGIQFRLIDTAGIREAKDAIEAIGIQKTFQKIRESSLLLYVFDVLKMPASEVWKDIEVLQREGLTIIGVANKMDLLPYAKMEDYQNEYLQHLIPISAANNMNIHYLKDFIFEKAVGITPQSEGEVISTLRHYEALKEAFAALSVAADHLQSGISGDWVAIEIRRATHYLGLVTGGISTDDLLDSIFRDFCIGK